MYMQNSNSGVERKILGGLHRLWAFLFGFIYYAAKGSIGWAAISFLTANGLLIGLPLWNRTIIQRHYENQGWKTIERPTNQTQ